MNELAVIPTAENPLDWAETATNRQRFDWFSEVRQQLRRMIDPVDGRISGRTTVGIFRGARNLQPLRAGSLVLPITPPSRHLFSRIKFRALAHVESSRDYSIGSKTCMERARLRRRAHRGTYSI